MAIDEQKNPLAAEEPTLAADRGEHDVATLSYYRERRRIRAELVLADWRTSLTTYLLVVLLAYIWA